MQIHNFLPLLTRCLEGWKDAPTESEFLANYFAPMAEQIGEVFDGSEFYSEIAELDWKKYRQHVLGIDPVREETRLRKNMQAVEKLFDVELQGDAVLFGTFHGMDGYARFDRGKHRVFLGVDESFAQGNYLDILEVHELVHVIRESRPDVWKGWGLDPRMSHDDFVENQPTVEHLFGEGFSCAVSELLIPNQEPWHYAYQNEKSLKRIFENAPSVDRAIRNELGLGEKGDWGRLYNSATYQPSLPIFTHYVWGWQWAKNLIQQKNYGGPAEIVQICSKRFVPDALAFELGSIQK